MPDLIAESAEDNAWFNQVTLAYSGKAEFGRIARSVIWTDQRGVDGELLIPINPEAYVEDINSNGLPLFKGHDPGRPIGKVLSAAVFISSNGTKFIAALLGYYQGKIPLGFRELGLEPQPAATSPTQLAALPDSCWIEFCADPREVDSAWTEDVLDIAPLRVERREASNNAAESSQELIVLGVLFMALVWNPFVTAVATEAGKDAYAALSRWLRRFLGKLAERRNPILEIQSHHDGCYVSFIFRGTDVKRHYAAHDALPLAAAQAATLVANMKRANVAAKKVVYEFHTEDGIWFPSYAELCDGRFVTDNSLLIAAEKLPSGVSLGIGLDKAKAQVAGRNKRLPR